MGALKTPFGEIVVTVDGKAIPYMIQEGKGGKEDCPDVLGRKYITIPFVPDGKEHKMSCTFVPCCTYVRTPESGERLECQSFYNESHQKMSIGLECEEALYLENGLSYKIPKESKREQYVFGICWIDEVKWNDQSEENQKRDVQTWFGADPSLPLKFQFAGMVEKEQTNRDLQVSSMRELINDPFYELIEKYDRCIVDYCLIEDDPPYQGYRSHKDAVLFAMLKVIERDESFPWNLDIEKAQVHQINPAELLHVPEILRTDRVGQRFYDCGLPDPLKGEQIPYWYAFWETPHRSGYGPDDFCKVNAVLFPKGTDELEVYEWTTDWSNYFDDGHEWWGTACWSIYDKHMNRYIVILASATD